MQKIQNFRQLHCPCKTDDIFKDSAKDVETRSDTSNYDFEGPLAICKN